MTTRQYAHLSDHSYGRDERGNPVDLQALKGKETTIGGIGYKVLDYVDRPSGYQGVIYQRVDTGDIIVAHRGTEFDRQKWEDLVKTDGGMALTGFNRQASDAIALTREALRIAESIKKEGDPVPSITVTGHSLGGTLGQVSGHYFGLRGETFNAYGAAGLTVTNPETGQRYRLPQGGHAFVNHVMAGDLVSAASPQYGQVRVYAAQREIDVLQSLGYENDRSQLDARRPVTAAVRNMLRQSHDMHNFLPWDGDRRPDQPIQEQTRAQALAQQYDPMIDKFRGDVHAVRVVVTNEPARNLFNRAPVLPAGAPARQHEELRLQEQYEELRRTIPPSMQKTPAEFFMSLPRGQAPVQKEKTAFDKYLDDAIAAFERGDFREFQRRTAEFADQEPGRQLLAQAERELEEERQRQMEEERQRQEQQQRESQAERIRGPVLRIG